MFTGSYNTAEDVKHTGLTVYNVNQCPTGRTIYDETGPQVWSGSRWKFLRPKPEVVDATPAQTSAATNTWGMAVVRHAAKAGVYEEFYSAWFGDAGRWMTTNLAATAYDGVTHLQSRTLTGPNANSGNAYNTAYWCYPNGGAGGTTPTDYTNNPHLGLLYTWDAATAGKGGTNGIGNTTNEGTTRGGGLYIPKQRICKQEC
jgi:hypothetical protein